MPALSDLGRPNTFGDARLQLHWALQPVMAAADARLAKANDDGQSNLGYAPGLPGLVGRVLPGDQAFGLRFVVPALVTLDHEGATTDELDLEGQTLDGALTWVNERLGEGDPAELRDYDMPDHPVRSGEPFAIDHDPVGALHAWSRLGHEALTAVATGRANTGEIRLWPHHFDLGTVILLREGDDPYAGRSIGVGMSLGDAHYEQPYFYVNPYGLPDSAERPGVPHGHWTPKWTGLVLTGDTIVATGSTDAAAEFLDAAVDACERLLTA